MDRRKFIHTTAGVAAGAVAGPIMARAFEQRPNIILILTDDQGYGELSCHGAPILETPNLDRLHAESTKFTNFQVSPTCASSRASLLTGKHEFRSGVIHNIVKAVVPEQELFDARVNLAQAHIEHRD